MAMTPRELVTRTLEFWDPERIPRQLWLLPWATNHFPEEVAEIQHKFPDDIITSPWFCESWNTKGEAYEVGQYVDEWGCVFENRHRGIIGEVKDPLVKNWDRIDKVKVPSEALTADVAKINDFCAGTDRFVRWVARELSPRTYVNLMDQYRPAFRAHQDDQLSRSLTQMEWRQAKKWAKEAGLTNLA